MKTMYCDDLFSIPGKADEAYVVTTNGMTKKDGTAVMGAGIAKYAAQLFPNLPALLGRSLKKYGNRVFAYKVSPDGINTYNVITMPTKHDWRDSSDLELIKTSCLQMMQVADVNGFTCIHMPKPGCANGRLDWETQVKPAIEPLLDDRFVVCI